MKIKTKKQLNLPQLIEYAMKNEIKDKVFNSNDKFSIDSVLVEFDYMGRFGSENNISKHKKFTIEVEEEITEDTRLDKLVVRYRNDDIYIFPQERINDFKNDSSIIAFYIPNDDLSMTLIWRDGKLVE